MKAKDMIAQDYFAAYALAGLLANPNIVKQDIFSISQKRNLYYYSILELAAQIGDDMTIEESKYSAPNKEDEK